MANISTLASTSHTITTQDALQGFCSVPVSWISSFFDTNYNLVWSIEDTSINSPSLNLSQGDTYNISPTGFEALIVLTNIPIVLATQVEINTSSPQSLSFSVPYTTTYQITLYYQSLATGNGSESLSPTITWVDPQGNIQSLAYPYIGPIVNDISDPNAATLQSYSIPFLAKANSTISVSFAFGGSYAFAYNQSISIVAMPVTPASQIGNTFIVHAMASHR